ncbi:MAG: 3D-(3,5/4)-trihydroxycyclohexane-1,2-dione acylhydrolase (decyclizing) [Trueperaceae bacterium]
MKTIRMTVGQALVRFLAVQFSERDGVEQRLIAGVWGIFGHGNVTGLGQALHEVGTKVGLPYYRPQNEQAQVHAAVAYAKHKRRLSAMACTASIGPGSTNMVTGAALATINRLPVLLLPSDIFANRLPDPVLQQLEHPTEHDLSVNDIFRPVSKFFARISRPEQLSAALPEAMRVLTDPAETGAVTVSLCQDVQTEAYDFPAAMFEKRVWHVRRPLAEDEMIKKAVDIITKAKQPLIVAGGGIRYSDASDTLAKFSTKFGIPVSETQAGKGATPWNHEMNVGAVGAIGVSSANELVKKADVVLVVGSRLGDFPTGSKTTFAESATLIGLNVTPMDAHKLFALPMIADAKRGLEQLSRALSKAGYKGTSNAKRAEIAKLKRAWNKTVAEVIAVKDPDHLAQAEVIGMVNKAFGGKAVVVNAAGSMPGDLVKLWRPDDDLAYHHEYGFSCMGYEIPAGIGVHMAEPKREVVVLIGDGSYLMLNSEIVTAVAEDMNLTIIVVDNHGYQSIHGLQRSSGSPSFGNELRYRNKRTGQLDGKYIDVDFALHAASMGAQAVFASSEEEFKAALEFARSTGGVKVIEVEVDPEKRVGGYGGWWDVPIAEVSKRTGVKKALAKYRKAKKKQVVFK